MEFERFGSFSSAFYSLLVSLGVFEWAYGATYGAVQRAVPRGGRLLEVGPGVGALLRRLVETGYDAVGVDASPEMLKRSRAKSVSVAGVSFRLPFRDEIFDAAVALFTLHHWGDHGPSLREVKRVLKPGGVFIAVEADQARLPLVGSHGCTSRCLRDVLSAEFEAAVERRFPLLLAYARKPRS
ncbi:class I SAM-dependent methyltransferase [Pyrobaculum neutrophilum]|uniref:Methyltransferase type 11 n=1 Tax=Pyrobaculum neutrophilum (strain DSM 2338 / JCM 9278 / NBRC 100436 / V24Sta) TaxID=444157 RepID=B1YB93_PYRNV|nr:class I SAM-dependent methyltransferase [Pyrobaculum neutrophilum]ACB39224.1 Methyltransferase type 11 [Pyrobaculum neutrophilum V24Sta]